MTTRPEIDQPSLPPGTYYIAVMLIGGDRLHGRSLRMHWALPMHPSRLAWVASANAAGLVPDELAGAQPGMWWLFQVMVCDAWGRSAIMSEQVAIDRSLGRDDLATEIARVAPDAVTTLGDGLVRLLTASKPARPIEPAGLAVDVPRTLN